MIPPNSNENMISFNIIQFTNSNILEFPTKKCLHGDNGSVQPDSEFESHYFKSTKRYTYRRDKFDQSILKGKKGHRVSFRDYVDNKKGLEDIYEVENYKDYNRLLAHSFYQEQTSCCRLF